ALNSSAVINVVKVMVLAIVRFSVPYLLIPQIYEPRVAAQMAMLCTIRALIISLSSIGSLGFLGGRFIISGSPFSIPNAKAGKLSVTKFNHKSCIGSNGTWKPNNMLKNMINTSPILQD